MDYLLRNTFIFAMNARNNAIIFSWHVVEEQFPEKINTKVIITSVAVVVPFPCRRLR
jgi:hypothetical protein